MIKYLGSKRLLIPALVDIVKGLGPEVRSVTDLFSGTSRVGHSLKKEGYTVMANDWTFYAQTLATCYVEADREDVERDAHLLVAEFNSMRGSPGYFTETFCQLSRFFQPKNGERVDAIREEIRRKSLDPQLEAVVLTSLMEAADRVDSTTGLQMAYLKQWAPRSNNDLQLRVPDVQPRTKFGPSKAFWGDARRYAPLVKTDVAYLDPPYNQHSYLGNYHIWESLVLWDKMKFYGIACKREDVKDRKSAFNSKRESFEALKEVIEGLTCPHMILSFSDEGFVSKEEILSVLAAKYQEVTVLEHDFKRYVGAQIGIHSPKGEKVGTVSHLRNKEYIFVAK